MSDVAWADRSVTFENFDPNKQFARKPMWGVFDGSRFKTYTQRGHAINGAHHHYRVKLYEQTAAGWVLRATKDESKRPDVCQNCGGSTLEAYSYWDYRLQRRVTPTDRPRVNEGKYVFRRQGRKLVEPVQMLFVCKACVPVVAP